MKMSKDDTDSDHSLDDIMGNIPVGRANVKIPSFSSSDFDWFPDTNTVEQTIDAKTVEQTIEAKRETQNPAISLPSTFEDDIDAVMAEIDIKKAPVPKSENQQLHLSTKPVKREDLIADLITDLEEDLEHELSDLPFVKPIIQAEQITQSRHEHKNIAELSSSMVRQGVLEDPFYEEPPSSPPVNLSSSPYFIKQNQPSVSVLESPNRITCSQKPCSQKRSSQKPCSQALSTVSPKLQRLKANTPITPRITTSQIEWEPSSRELYGYDLHTLNLRQKSELKVYGRLLDNFDEHSSVKRLKSEEEFVPEEPVTETEEDVPRRTNRPRAAKTQASKVLQQLDFSNRLNFGGAIAKKTGGKIQSRLYVTSAQKNTLVDVDGEKDGLMTVQVASLSAEQQTVHDLVLNGETNIFFTGAAGTGKSVLLRQIIASLKAKFHHQLDRVAVTASTGLAACNVHGMTLHSFAGCGLAREDVDSLCKRIRRNKKARDRWRKVSVLVIDEISMVDARFFDKLEAIARKLRRNQRPFGGIQLIVTGDFYQLPPVPDTNKDRFRGSYGNGNSGMIDSRSSLYEESDSLFAFEAESWPKVIDHTFLLTRVFRQKDPTFANMLNQLRTQSLDKDSLDGFLSLSRPLKAPDGIIPTELFPTRREVDRSNFSKLSTLKGDVRTFDALETGSAEGEFREKLLENIMVPKKLVLKAGAQVMMLKNMDPNLVNGSIGVVVGFMSPHTFVAAENAADLDSMRNRTDRPNIYNVSNEAELRELTRLIELGKVSGESDQSSSQPVYDEYSSQDCVFERLKAFPEHPDNATFLERKLERRKKLQELVKSNLAALDGTLYPVVRFRRMDHTFRNVLLHPETFSVENIEGEVLASRTQIPLILAWALSIHKAQGQTLQYVKVDLAKTFEKGQAYVALSRATSKEGLQVLNFLPDKVKTHPKVVEFYKTLSTYDDKQIQEEQKENLIRAVG